MKKLKRKEKLFDENIITQATTSTNFTKRNKMLFYKTITSNFSQEQNKNEILSRNKSIKNKGFKSVKPLLRNKKIESPIPKFKSINESPKEKRRKSIVTINNTPKKENEKNIESFENANTNSLLPTNINSYRHLLRGTDFGIYENLNWTLRLRDYSHKGMHNKVIDYKDYYYRENAKTSEIKQEKMQLTQDFNPPSYYDEDLNKYKRRIQTASRPLIKQLNPNFNKIKHLLFGNNNGKVNYSQFKFETTLRNLKYEKNNENKKWQVLPVVKTDKYMTRFLSPVTPKGIDHLKNIEKYIHKNYEYNFKDEYVGNDKIKKKLIYDNKNYTISGIGETLGDEKYNNHFWDNNMFANKKILSTESNPQCKFELGLRHYESDKDKKYLTQTNFRAKKNKIK